MLNFSEKRIRGPAGWKPSAAGAALRLAAAAAAAALLLAACGEADPPPSGGPAEPAGESAAPSAQVELTPVKAGAYDAPPMAQAEFHGAEAATNGSAWIDTSAAAEGYVAAAVLSEKRVKFQVVKGDMTCNYDLASDGEPRIFPLNGGDGEYLLRIMENVAENRYAEVFSAVCEAELKDEFQPFIRPNVYVDYDSGSACVKKSAELAREAGDQIGLVSAVYDYICGSVVYDAQKAEGVTKGYLPDPDATFKSGEGICFDYASLAAAMLRSQGIPTKLICGYVSPDGLYHAWNMFYTDETGWVTVEYKVSGPSWNRLDLTFSAGGADAQFVGDGDNYSDVYVY